MGWWYQDTQPKDLKEFFSTQFGTGERNGVFREIVDLALVNMREVYIAYRIKDIEKNEDKVIGIVILVDYARDGRFGYKDMDESMGPNYYNCPKRILDLLTPTEYEYAQEWRRLCYEKMESKKKASKLKDGDILDFEKPITFNGNAGSYQTFRITKQGRKMLFYGIRDGLTGYGLLKITKWKDMNFIVVDNPDHLLIDLLNHPQELTELLANRLNYSYLLEIVRNHISWANLDGRDFNIAHYIKEMLESVVYNQLIYILNILHHEQYIQLIRLMGGKILLKSTDKTMESVDVLFHHYWNRDKNIFWSQQFIKVNECTYDAKQQGFTVSFSRNIDEQKIKELVKKLEQDLNINQ